MLTTLKGAGILAATTIGAGVFALPYLFAKAGWLTGTAYLLFLGLLLGWVHRLYLQALAQAGGKKRLLAFLREEQSDWLFGLSVIAVVGGLVLTLVVYLVLGVEFTLILFPSLDARVAFFLFWIIGTGPIALGVRRIGSFEFLGTFLLVGIMLGLFFYGAGGIRDVFRSPAFVFDSLLLPFGAVLFSLAGWTALEPLYATHGGSPAFQKRLFMSLWLGTAIVVASYLLFIGGVLGSGVPVAPDALSGFVFATPRVARFLSIFGLFALWTSYIPVGFEIKNLLGGDMGWSYAFPFVAAVPPLLVVLGVDTFIEAIGIAGGVFVALQYALILFVARKKVLQPGIVRSFTFLVSVLFFLVALYEAYGFFI